MYIIILKLIIIILIKMIIVAILVLNLHGYIFTDDTIYLSIAGVTILK